MAGKTPLLIIGDAAVPIGFSRVIRSVFERLGDGYELHQLATRCAEVPDDYPWRLYPAAAEAEGRISSRGALP